MRVRLTGLGTGPEVRAMRIIMVPETDTLARELELVRKSIALIETSENTAYRDAALKRLRRRLAQLRG